ncbi:MAG: GMC family oxidoreductase [Deltaproteobacteria bacterium]|nr:GMC family oxidoreductase [Deltaproteobacteria bacterium]
MQNGYDKRYDVIVVGTGPGGGTVARELTKAGKRVLMLERGPHPEIKGSFWQYLRYCALPPHSMLITNGGIGIVRGLLTGGSSVFYYGSCFKVPVDMLKRYGVDVTAEMEETRKDLPIGPLKQEMMTPMADRIMASAQELGYHWNKLDKFMYQDRWRPGMKFGYYGDPHRVKWSSRMYVEEAVEKGAVLVNDAKVEKVIIEDNRATGVEFVKKGRRQRAVASRVIVSAGGIGSPVILRNSGIQGVGMDFFYDPLVTACGTVADLKAGDEIPMSAGVHLQDEGVVMTDMSIPPPLDALFSLSALRVHKVFSQNRMLRIMIKIKDGLGGRITDGEQVRKGLTRSDKQKLRNGYERAKKILENAGAKGVFRTWVLAAHPGGSVKLGSILDSNLKTNRVDALYVCDCSVIPEAWGLPPTFTLICLGKRLAKHLMRE